MREAFREALLPFVYAQCAFLRQACPALFLPALLSFVFQPPRVFLPVPPAFFESRSVGFYRLRVEAWVEAWVEVLAEVLIEPVLGAEALVVLGAAVLVEAEGGERFEVERLPFLPASVARGGGWQVR